MKTIAALVIAFVFSIRPGIAIAAAVGRPEYLESFDPAKGFKPAQPDLTEIFLQLAGSLEAYGSPEPYLRHVAAEHNRIANLYRERSGKTAAPFWPDYLSDEYIEKASANWNLLSPKLGLEPLAKEAGRLIRVAIVGADKSALGEIFKRHQKAVFNQMTNKPTGPADFESLRAELEQKLLTRDSGHTGTAAAQIRDLFQKLYARLDQGLKSSDAERVKTVLTSMVMDIGEMADSELKAGFLGWALESPVAYNAENEIKLSVSERKQLAAFLAKSRFTNADFAELDRFYKGPYERLSDEGKDEMSKRVWNGTRK